MFRDRAHAGQMLAHALLPYAPSKPVVLALPRGGVVVGYEVARALGAPLDVLVVRKIGAPMQPELGIGAVGAPEGVPEVLLDDPMIQRLGVDETYLREEIVRQVAEIRRREHAYRQGRPPLEVRGRVVIVVDDGIATGVTMRAALQALRRRQPARIVLAVPVGPGDTIEALRAQADDVVCLHVPRWFHAVGQFYHDFTQTTDENVVDLLRRANEQFPADHRLQEPPGDDRPDRSSGPSSSAGSLQADVS